MQRDGRSFDHKTLESIRLMAVERVREWERASSVICSYGFNRTTIYKWLAIASSAGKGVKALRSRPATGRPRTGYAPELNPDELVWSHVNWTRVSRTPLRKGEKLSEKIGAQLAAIKKMPRLVRAFFKTPSVAYITD